MGTVSRRNSTRASRSRTSRTSPTVRRPKMPPPEPDLDALLGWFAHAVARIRVPHRSLIASEHFGDEEFVLRTELAALDLLGISSIAKVRATDHEALADARCIVVAMKLATLNDPQQRSAGVMLTIYYLGRLDGRSLHTDTERLMEQQARKMTSAELRSDAVRCEMVLTRKGQEMVRIGADLSHKSQGGVPLK